MADIGEDDAQFSKRIHYFSTENKPTMCFYMVGFDSQGVLCVLIHPTRILYYL